MEKTLAKEAFIRHTASPRTTETVTFPEGGALWNALAVTGFRLMNLRDSRKAYTGEDTTGVSHFSSTYTSAARCPSSGKIHRSVITEALDAADVQAGNL